MKRVNLFVGVLGLLIIVVLGSVIAAVVGGSFAKLVCGRSEKPLSDTSVFVEDGEEYSVGSTISEGGEDIVDPPGQIIFDPPTDVLVELSFGEDGEVEITYFEFTFDSCDIARQYLVEYAPDAKERNFLCLYVKGKNRKCFSPDWVLEQIECLSGEK